ncbi:MAG: hypothetical protein Q8O42_06000 [Acidobacteriota bacterium]|nr:hypothetical protein [Acidobacteriota bacterium]
MEHTTIAVDLAAGRKSFCPNDSPQLDDILSESGREELLGQDSMIVAHATRRISASSLRVRSTTDNRVAGNDIVE